MIKARQLALHELDDDKCSKFLLSNQRIAPQQIPAQAIATLGVDGLRLFGFFVIDALIGYAIVQIRHKVLAEVFHGPVVLDRQDYLACVTALQQALRRMWPVSFLRILPPYAHPRPQGAAGKFNWSTMVVDISMDEEQLLKSFSPNHRQSIRKGLSAGIQINALAAADEQAYVAGYVRMFANRGIEVSPKATASLLEAVIPLQDSGQAYILVARGPEEGHLIGGGMYLISGDTCTYYQGWSSRTVPPLPVLHILIWHAMLQAKAKGCTCFDLSGYAHDESDPALKAINDFKRWFRGQLLHYPATAIIPVYSILKPLMPILGKRL